MNEETKKCSKCGIEKSINEFYFDNTHGSYFATCKKCYLYNKKYREEHVEERKQYKKSHKRERNQYRKSRMLTDPVYKMKQQMRVCIFKSFSRKGLRKSDRTSDIVGLNDKDLYDYLIQTYMNNYGYEWDGVEEVHIDHKTPLSTATTEEDVIKLCHYSNLQLLKSADNLEKSDKLDWKLTDF